MLSNMSTSVHRCTPSKVLRLVHRCSKQNAVDKRCKLVAMNSVSLWLYSVDDWT